MGFHFQLVVLDQAKQPLASFPLGPSPLFLGRAPSNDVVLVDGTVSTRHLAIWVNNRQVWVEDLGSRNGTYILDKKTERRTVLKAGSVVRLGQQQCVRIDKVVAKSVEATRALLVRSEDGALSFPVRKDRVRIGPGHDNDLVVAMEPEESVVLIFHANGEIWLGRSNDEQPLEVGEGFDIGGKKFTVVHASDELSPTLGVLSKEEPVSLNVRLDGPTGAIATVRAGEVEHIIHAENRAVLLYLLGRRLQSDLDEGLPVLVAGWLPDADIGTGIWGRSATGKNLNVLVTRVRAELRDHGVDPWFIEKRRGHTRVRVATVRVG